MGVKTDSLASAIAKELAEYSQDVTDSLKEEIKRVAKECRREIQEKSPVLTGSYRKGWRDKIEYENAEDIRIVVRNRTDYQLTHLLEYGHAGRGGTAKGAAPPQPHIGPAEENAGQKLMRKVKVIVKK